MLDWAEKFCARYGNGQRKPDCHCSGWLEERGIDVTHRKETNPRFQQEWMSKVAGPVVSVKGPLGKIDWSLSTGLGVSVAGRTARGEPVK